jgi:hypothetical protein
LRLFNTSFRQVLRRRPSRPPWAERGSSLHVALGQAGQLQPFTAMTPSTISRDELREMLEALHDTAAARGETDILSQCRGFLEELNRRGDNLVVSEEMIAKLAKRTWTFVAGGDNETDGPTRG